MYYRNVNSFVYIFQNLQYKFYKILGSYYWDDAFFEWYISSHKFQTIQKTFLKPKTRLVDDYLTIFMYMILQ